MNEQEAADLQERINRFNVLKSKSVRIDKILTMLNAFIAGEEHDIGMILFDPTNDTVGYMTRVDVRDGRLQSRPICSLPGDENDAFVKAFFHWAAESYFAMEKITVNNEMEKV